MANIIKKVGDLAGFLNYSFEKYFVSKFLGNMILGREVSGRVYTCPEDEKQKTKEAPKAQNYLDYGNPIQNAVNYFDDPSIPYRRTRTTKEALNLHLNPPSIEELEARIEKLVFETGDDFKDKTDSRAIANSINRELLIKSLLGYYVNHVKKEKRLQIFDELAKELKVGIEYTQVNYSLIH